MSLPWDGVVQPFFYHNEKPRRTGLTMVMDKGLGISATADLLNLAGKYIDFLKLGFGTSVLYPLEVLTEKIKLGAEAGVEVYPGGTLLEAAIISGTFKECLKRARILGIKALELSDGTIPIESQQRRRYINELKDNGFKVITEVGKKDINEQPTIDQMRDSIMKDLDAGADLIIVEARESGKGIGIFDKEGNVKKEELAALMMGINHERIMFEAPHKPQQVELIKGFGPNVNLGNIAVDEILALETLRTGLRGDTLKKHLASIAV